MKVHAGISNAIKEPVGVRCHHIVAHDHPNHESDHSGIIQLLSTSRSRLPAGGFIVDPRTSIVSNLLFSILVAQIRLWTIQHREKVITVD